MSERLMSIEEFKPVVEQFVEKWVKEVKENNKLPEFEDYKEMSEWHWFLSFRDCVEDHIAEYRQRKAAEVKPA